eukprot:PhF_6_TR9893/c1_g1_i1/m.15084
MSDVYASYHNEMMEVPNMYQQGASVCMCPECEYYRAANSWAAMQQMVAAAPPMMSQPQVGRKYSHNPYAPLSDQPDRAQSTLSSMPPVITANDTLAPIVANIADYDVLANTPMYPVAPQMQYTLQEQFNSAIGSIGDMSCTPRGRSMLQAVIRLRQPEQIATIFAEMTNSEQNIIARMLDANACHVMRALIEVIEVVDAQYIANSSVMTDMMVIQLATTSQHTRRILQALFERFSAQQFCHDISNILAHNAPYLATTQQGCIALMRVIDHATSEQSQMIHEKLFPAMASLAMDPYGNYVIQHMIEKGDTNQISEAVAIHFLPHIVPLCCNKFASNVMEKVFYCVTPTARKALLDGMLFTNGTLHILMHDSFGNFVIQASIESCNNVVEFRKLAERMRPLIHTSPYGHKIEAKLKSKRLARTSVAPPSPVASAPTTPTLAQLGSSEMPLAHCQSY